MVSEVWILWFQFTCQSQCIFSIWPHCLILFSYSAHQRWFCQWPQPYTYKPYKCEWWDEGTPSLISDKWADYFRAKLELLTIIEKTPTHFTKAVSVTTWTIRTCQNPIDCGHCQVLTPVKSEVHVWTDHAYEAGVSGKKFCNMLWSKTCRYAMLHKFKCMGCTEHSYLPFALPCAAHIDIIWPSLSIRSHILFLADPTV